MNRAIGQPTKAECAIWWAIAERCAGESASLMWSALSDIIFCPFEEGGGGAAKLRIQYLSDQPQELRLR